MVEGDGIYAEELKRAIKEREEVTEDSLDLALTNAHTNIPIHPHEIIPRGSSLIVYRVQKPPEEKIWLPDIL